MNKLFIAVLAIAMFACKKEAQQTSDNPSNPNPTTPATPSFIIPTTVGSWWKYNRTDSTIKYDKDEKMTAFSVKLSEELMSVIGPSTLVNGTKVTAYKIENFTIKTLDTIYIQNTADTIAFFTPLKPYTNGQYPYFFFTLPVITKRISPYGILPYVVADTSLTVNTLLYEKLAYMWRHGESWSSSWHLSGDSHYFLKHNLGIVRIEERDKMSYAYAGADVSVTVKVLVDKKINP
jgi:hypothetical protein